MRRSPYQAFAAILIMAFTFIVGGLFFLVILGSSTALSYFESKPQLIVFFADETEKSLITALEEKVKAIPGVTGIKYISKDEALALYQEWYQNDPLLLEMVTADILPQSIEVSARDARVLEGVAKQVENEEGVEDIEYQADVVKQLTAWTTTIRMVGIGLVSFLVIESLLVMMTVIGMRIAMKRREIKIMSLIGATNWYIGKPFLLEGMLYGMFGSLTGWLASIGTLVIAAPYVQQLLGSVVIDPLNPVFFSLFFVGMIGSGMILGGLGSFLALLRYLP